MKHNLLLIFISIIIVTIQTSPQLPLHTMEVFGNASMGYYYVNLYVGRPAQPQSVIIDTGSGILTTPCSKCELCGKGHINNYFEVQKSVSSKFLTCEAVVCSKNCGGSKDGTKPCEFSISYAEGSSLNGVYLEDYIQLENKGVQEGVKAHFGCTTRETNLFLKQEANGIFGLAPERSNLLEQIFREHSGFTGEKLEFSICLSSNGGFLTVGGSNDTYHTEQPIETTFDKQMNLYALQNVGSAKIGSKTFHQTHQSPGPYGIFVDCGSTFTYFPRKQFKQFHQQIESLCDGHKSECQRVGMVDSMHCYRITPETINQQNLVQDLQNLVSKIFPAIEMEVNGQSLYWDSTEYFMLRNRQNREVCLGVSELDRFLLGANWMVNKDILFNNEKNFVRIYQNSKCSGNFSPSAIIKQQMPKKQKLSPISTTQSHYKSSQFYFALGIIFLVIAFGFLASFLFYKMKKHQILTTIQKNNKPEEIHQEEAMTISNQLQTNDHDQHS